MEHHFRIDLAERFGILEAIILSNLQFWLAKNAANGTNFFDGSYWTFNSVKAFSTLFPYASAKQIRTALKHLVDEGILKTGNYNKSSYDRTLWYAFTDKGLSILPIGQMEFPEKENRNSEKGEPIPYNKPDEKPDKKQKERKKEVNSYDEVIKEKIEDEEVKEAIYEFIKMRKLVKKPLTNNALNLLIKRLDKLATDSKDKVEILNQSIVNNWLNVYPLKSGQYPEKNNGGSRTKSGQEEVDKDYLDYLDSIVYKGE